MKKYVFISSENAAPYKTECVCKCFDTLLPMHVFSSSLSSFSLSLILWLED